MAPQTLEECYRDFAFLSELDKGFDIRKLVKSVPKDILSQVKDKFETDLLRAETKMQTLEDANPDIKNQTTEYNFEINENSKDSIQLITEIEADVEEWLEQVAENKWSLNCLRFFFAFLKDYQSE